MRVRGKALSSEQAAWLEKHPDVAQSLVERARLAVSDGKRVSRRSIQKMLGPQSKVDDLDMAQSIVRTYASLFASIAKGIGALQSHFSEPKQSWLPAPLDLLALPAIDRKRILLSSIRQDPKAAIDYSLALIEAAAGLPERSLRDRKQFKKSVNAIGRPLSQRPYANIQRSIARPDHRESVRVRIEEGRGDIDLRLDHHPGVGDAMVVSGWNACSISTLPREVDEVNARRPDFNTPALRAACYGHWTPGDKAIRINVINLTDQGHVVQEDAEGFVAAFDEILRALTLYRKPD